MTQGCRPVQYLSCARGCTGRFKRIRHRKNSIYGNVSGYNPDRAVSSVARSAIAQIPIPIPSSLPSTIHHSAGAQRAILSPQRPPSFLPSFFPSCSPSLLLCRHYRFCFRDLKPAKNMTDSAASRPACRKECACVRGWSSLPLADILKTWPALKVAHPKPRGDCALLWLSQPFFIFF